MPKEFPSVSDNLRKTSENFRINRLEREELKSVRKQGISITC